MGRTVFTNANLVDGEHPAKPGSTVIIEGNRITSVGTGTRRPVNISEGVSTVRQPPQSLEIAWKFAATQRRAAPMPRVSDLVSLSVWRVPKLTSLAIVACC